MPTNHSPAAAPASVSLAALGQHRQLGRPPGRRGPKGLGALLKPQAGPNGVRPKDKIVPENVGDSRPVPEDSSGRRSSDVGRRLDAVEVREPDSRHNPEGILPVACDSPDAAPQSAVAPAVHRTSVPRQPFLNKYCALQRIGHSAYVRHLFLHCAPPWTLPFLGILWVFHRRSLSNDFRLIDQVAEVTTYREFLGAVETFTYRNRESGYLREVLKIRLSANLLMRFGAQLMPPLAEPMRPK